MLWTPRDEHARGYISNAMTTKMLGLAGVAHAFAQSSPGVDAAFMCAFVFSFGLVESPSCHCACAAQMRACEVELLSRWHHQDSVPARLPSDGHAPVIVQTLDLNLFSRRVSMHKCLKYLHRCDSLGL